MILTYQSPSTSMAKQYEHNVNSRGESKGNRFLPHQLHSNTHILPNPTHAIFEGETNASKTGYEKYDQSVNLPCTVDEDDSNS